MDELYEALFNAKHFSVLVLTKSTKINLEFGKLDYLPQIGCFSVSDDNKSFELAEKDIISITHSDDIPTVKEDFTIQTADGLTVTVAIFD